MSMEIAGISRAHPDSSSVSWLHRGEKAASQPSPPPSTIEIEASIAELERVSGALNRRLKFSINRDLGQVVVKIVDASTDKVIKELPPRELQRLHVRIRETIGLLFDERI